MLPYFFIESARVALFWSIGVTAVILLLFGWFKTYYTGALIFFIPDFVYFSHAYGNCIYRC